jgi:hypothetical protein
VVGSDVTINKRLFSLGDASLNGNLFVKYDTSLNSRLVVGSDVTINKRLFTLGDASFNGNLQMNTMYIASTDNVNSWIVNKSLISNISTAFALFQGSGGNTVLNSYTGQPLQFKINNSEKMRVCQNGNISIGSDTDVSAFVQIYNSSSATTYPTLSVGDGSSNNANLILYSSNFGSGYAGRIQGRNSNGKNYFQHRDNSATFLDIGYWDSTGISAIAFYQSSDIRFKNILETNPNITLELDVIKYTRTDNETDKIRYGYSAQQVKDILPDLVNDGEKLTVNYTDIHTLKIAALEKRITELENRIKALESK